LADLKKKKKKKKKKKNNERENKPTPKSPDFILGFNQRFLPYLV